MNVTDIKAIQGFFFEGMRNGWTTTAKKMSHPDFPGLKMICYRKYGLLLIDAYLVSPGSNTSHGMTIIVDAENRCFVDNPFLDNFGFFFDNPFRFFIQKPIWAMHYGGWYDKRVIPVLKRILMRNYSQNIFTGGRGPERLEVEDHTLQYLNRVEKNDFASFRGSEQIITTSEQWQVPVGQKMGEHYYFGGLFV